MTLTSLQSVTTKLEADKKYQEASNMQHEVYTLSSDLLGEHASATLDAALKAAQLHALANEREKCIEMMEK